ncbi:MAG: 30S ribosomal protein S12 methylthiotransferase RimO [Bacteroidaceae bacterium]|nr:30S ribosomal protein S12 methylthiotransferase RimO [Bacteroidaceae bacterium]
MRVDVITLGCSKNLVDSEKLLKQFEAEGYAVRHDPDAIDADIVVINTCGFIGDAQEESIEMILECCELKKQGVIKALYVMGCLSQKFGKELKTEIPEVDKYYGKFDWTNLLQDLNGKWHSDLENSRFITTPSHYAYLKIAEGCDRRCSYCAIPLMTGGYRSRNQEDIINEAKYLISRGVKEIQLIAQDLTYYGIDRYGKSVIADLTKRLSDLDGLEWIRLHYGYPNDFPMDLLQVMRERDNVCKYMDLALQHISNPVLERMHRNITAEQTRDLLYKIRQEVPGIHLRTTLMVGFPGETEDDYEQLVDFVKEMRFERMGAFAYCEVEGTYSARHYNDDIDDEIKQNRLSRLMRVQQNISADINQNKIGKVFKTVIDRIEGEYYIGRTEFDSPDVDPEMLIKADSELSIGNFYDVRVTDAVDFDLYGDIENNS